MLKKLIAYKYLTMGGVERIILNRATLYKKYNLPIKLYVYFLYGTNFAKESFCKYVVQNKLESHIQLIENIKLKKFDIVSIIDTPELFDIFPDAYVECHSSYVESISYLHNFKNKDIKIITPTELVKEEISKEYKIEKKKIYVLENFVIQNEPVESYKIKRIWNKVPLFYFGRLDALKNPQELFAIFENCKRNSEDFIFIIATNSINEISIFLEKYKKLLDSIILLPEISFSKVPEFLSLMKAHKGIFISSSQNETFGMSSAEAIWNGIPAVLSDNRGHKYITNNNSKFLYRLGDIESATEKILTIKDNYYEPILEKEHLIELQKRHLEKIKHLLGI